ncbi:DUF1800 domain-containing protein [Dehalococcoidia bacterium]|nr:DUF1800 domain-containing protein [Dehalococcoidia bacterium]
MPINHLELVAHLMRRAGVGLRREELERYSGKKYEDIVEEVINPERFPEVDDDLLFRYWIELNNRDQSVPFNSRWVYRMINTDRHLQEKIALFWHHIFATSQGKSEHPVSSIEQIELFRKNGLGKVRDILGDLARDPAMIFFLDNNENHKNEPNENWGRELLELFSMGVGNYTEDDIKMASKAFTGWTYHQIIPLDPYGRYPAEFRYIEEDHEDGPKTFLGQTGNFNGDDIIDIIVEKPACAKFISRHLYNFFVADEVQVPSWNDTAPKDEQAIKSLMKVFEETDGDIRAMLRFLFNSDFFKQAQYKRVKSPAELVAGTIRLMGTNKYPEPDFSELGEYFTRVTGQALMTPPTVEGWHTGMEWIDGGTLTERVNFAVSQVEDTSSPGLRDISERLSKNSSVFSPEYMVDGCLEMMGVANSSDDVRGPLIDYVKSEGDLYKLSEEDYEEFVRKISNILKLVVSTIDYQFA